MIKARAFLLLFLTIVCCSLTNADTKIANLEKALISQIISSKLVQLTGTNFEKSISTNTKFTTEPIVKVCIDDSIGSNKSFNFMILTDQDNIIDSNFAIFNKRLGKIKTSIQLSGSADTSHVEIQPNNLIVFRSDDNHSSGGRNCTHSFSLKLIFDPKDLREAYTGTYSLAINLFTLEDQD